MGSYGLSRCRPCALVRFYASTPRRNTARLLECHALGVRAADKDASDVGYVEAIGVADAKGRGALDQRLDLSGPFRPYLHLTRPRTAGANSALDATNLVSWRTAPSAATHAEAKAAAIPTCRTVLLAGRPRRGELQCTYVRDAGTSLASRDSEVTVSAPNGKPQKAQRSILR